MNHHPLLSEYGHFKYSLEAFVEDLRNRVEPIKRKIEREDLDYYQTKFLEFTGKGDWDNFYIRPRQITFIYNNLRIHRTYSLEALFQEISHHANLGYDDKALSHYLSRLRKDGFRLYMDEDGIIVSMVKLTEFEIQSEFIPDSSDEDEIINFENDDGSVIDLTLLDDDSENPFISRRSKRIIIKHESDDEIL